MQFIKAKHQFIRPKLLVLPLVARAMMLVLVIVLGWR
jgi:hypothetical protein